MNDIIPICRWLFQEAGGSPRVSDGKYNYALQEMNGPINRIEDGILGPYSAQIIEGQWFNLPRILCPALNFHGKDVQFSIIACIKRKQKSFNECGMKQIIKDNIVFFLILVFGKVLNKFVIIYRQLEVQILVINFV
jgi:hypothetical protein